MFPCILPRVGYIKFIAFPTVNRDFVQRRCIHNPFTVRLITLLSATRRTIDSHFLFGTKKIKALANPKHLKILNQGIDNWNLWRKLCPEVVPNLCAANLEHADLHAANLSKTNLSKTRLSYAFLGGANLRHANLNKADLNNTNLQNADLSSANLANANLSEANLIGANLTRTNFIGADLRHVALRNIKANRKVLAVLQRYFANPEHCRILRSSVKEWNQWREENPHITPNLIAANLKAANLVGANLSNAILRFADLNGANLTKACLKDANLISANLSRADLSKANLRAADLSGADLSLAKLSSAELFEANLTAANLTHANLKKASLILARLAGGLLLNTDLRGAQLREANLNWAWLNGANLRDADLTAASLIYTQLDEANLTGCKIFGLSAWKLSLKNTIQKDLVISEFNEPIITVDNLEVAQFIYLLLNRKQIRNVLDTITSKVVLLLGCFTPERKAVLDALADELRKNNLLPIIFDFERTTNRDFTETIKILAGLSLFVIVDITKPKSTPQELTATVPDYQIPFVPILEEGEEPYSMFVDFKKYDWVLKPIRKYRTKEVLLANFMSVILKPALEKHLELKRKKNEQFESVSIEDMIAKKEESSA
jgi:uncharacterized protein YjbI with pentapeptide repeats